MSLDGGLAVRDVLVILAGPKFAFDEEALAFDRALPSAATVLVEDAKLGLHAAGMVAPDLSLVVCEFVSGMQVWLAGSDSIHQAAADVAGRAKKMVASLDGWPKHRLRLTFLPGQFVQLSVNLKLALWFTPGIEIRVEDPAGAANLFGPVLPTGMAAPLTGQGAA